MVIPKNGAIGILAFLPQKQFLWPCVAPPKSGGTNSAGISGITDAQDSSITSDAGDGQSNPYECFPPPQKHDEKWLFIPKSRDAKLKDLNSAQMNRLQQSLEVLVAGVHVVEVKSNGTVTDFSCDSDQQMFKDDAVTCKLKGTNLDKVAALTLTDPTAGSKTAPINGTVKPNAGDNTAGTVSFSACAINQLPKVTYQVSIPAGGGDSVQKATFAKKDDPLAASCTAVSKGKSIDCDLSKMSKAEASLIETVTLSSYDKGTKFSPAITPIKLDASLKASFKDNAVASVLKKAVPGDVTIQAKSKDSTTAIDTCVTPTTLNSVKLSLDLGTSATLGSPMSFKVMATDANGVDTEFSGTVHFTNTDKNASALDDYSFVAEDKGIHEFPVTFKTKGPQTVTVESEVAASGAASTTVSGAPGAGAKLSLSLPKSVTSGAVTTTKVMAEDETGKVDAEFTGKIHFTNTDKNGSVPPDYSFLAGDKGVHEFSITFRTKGQQTLTVVSSGLKSASASTTVK